MEKNKPGRGSYFVIVPYLLHLPDKFIGKNVELIAFSTEDISVEKNAIIDNNKRQIKDAIAFFKKNTVDFSKLEKWNREDLYD